MLFPRKEEVLQIHGKLLEQFGGLPGMRDEGLLDSALLSAAQRQHYEGADLATCAATYAFHLTRNHPFVDGNKRSVDAPLHAPSPGATANKSFADGVPKREFGNERNSSTFRAALFSKSRG
jgi:hypothetical protein